MNGTNIYLIYIPILLIQFYWDMTVFSSLLWEDSLGPDILNYAMPRSEESVMQRLERIENIVGCEDDLHTTKWRRTRWIHLRIHWNRHVHKLIHENEFQRDFGMTLPAFNNLSQILKDSLTRKRPSSRVQQPVSIEIILATALRYLRGGQVCDLKTSFGLSRAEVYNCRDCVLSAVMNSERLQIKMPQSAEEWEEVRRGFEAKSSGGFVHGCVGAIDGFFQKMKCPSWKDAQGNQDAYVSGNYKAYGVNCQAVCDASLRFLFFGVVAPGRTNDNVAVQRCGRLLDIINSLPDGLFMVGDAAYTLMEHLLIPFSGCLAEEPDHDAYNFYISQLRIRIEMAFGMLVSKFGILRTVMRTTIWTTIKILISCATLHNYIINWNQANGEGVGEIAITANGCSEGSVGQDSTQRVRMGPDGSMLYNPTLPEEGFEEIPGSSNI